MSAVGDARKRLDESTARPESGEACTCPYTDPKYWLSAASCGYGSGYEPGSMQEWDPDCPVHRPAPVAEPADDLATLCAEAITQVASSPHSHWREGGAGGTCRTCEAATERARDLRARLDALLARRDEKRDREAVGKLAAVRAVLAIREGELLALKGPCSNDRCRLHHAHSGPCDTVTALAEIEGA